MGKEIARLAEQKGHHIIATYDIDAPLSAPNLDQTTDVLIDFTEPSAVPQNVKEAVAANKPIVIGTTGWYDKLDDIEEQIADSETAAIYASNFSLGINLFFRIVESAARSFDKFEDYDSFIHEIHHRGKIDSPSGTALSLAQLVLDSITRKKELLTDRSDGKIDPAALHISSTRAGQVPGTHTVAFDSEADTIELKHTARNRSGFALGAIYAAEWIVGKRGLFTMDDLLKDLLEK